MKRTRDKVIGEGAKPIGKSAFERLQARQARFVVSYLESFNATKAYIAAGYAGKDASAGGSQLLRNPKVSEAIRVELEVRGITRERVCLHMACIAFSTDLAEFDRFLSGQATLGQLRAEGVDTSLIRRAVEHRKVTEGSQGEVVEIVHRAIESYSRLDALNGLARVLGITSETVRHEHQGLVLPDFRNMSEQELQRYARAVLPMGREAAQHEGSV